MSNKKSRVKLERKIPHIDLVVFLLCFPRKTTLVENVLGVSRPSDKLRVKIVLFYLTAKETLHLLFVNFLVLNEIVGYLFFHCVKLNYGRL